MTDKLPFYAPDRRPDPPKQRVPGERLWTVTKDGHRRYAELRDNGEFGVEFQLFADVDTFLYGQRFESRAGAMYLSNQERDQRLREGWVWVDGASAAGVADV